MATRSRSSQLLLVNQHQSKLGRLSRPRKSQSPPAQHTLLSRSRIFLDRKCSLIERETVIIPIQFLLIRQIAEVPLALRSPPAQMLRPPVGRTSNGMDSDGSVSPELGDYGELGPPPRTTPTVSNDIKSSPLKVKVTGSCIKQTTTLETRSSTGSSTNENRNLIC